MENTLRDPTFRLSSALSRVILLCVSCTVVLLLAAIETQEEVVRRTSSLAFLAGHWEAASVWTVWQYNIHRRVVNVLMPCKRIRTIWHDYVHEQLVNRLMSPPPLVTPPLVTSHHSGSWTMDSPLRDPTLGLGNRTVNKQLYGGLLVCIHSQRPVFSRGHPSEC